LLHLLIITAFVAVGHISSRESTLRRGKKWMNINGVYFRKAKVGNLYTDGSIDSIGVIKFENSGNVHVVH